jgi:hypothetical protein
MRYPIFEFDGDDLAVYDTPDDHWNHLEVYDVDYPDVLLDSDGRLLRKSDAGNERVRITEADAEADPEQLRRMLIHALQARGQPWGADAPLDSLILAAQATSYERGRNGIGDAFCRLLRFLRLKTPP